MFGTSKHLIACAVLIALAAPQARAQFDASPYCALVRENYNIADPEACNSYFTCTNGVATKKTCGTNLYYNKNTQTCTSSSLVCSQNSDPCAGTVGQTYRPVENDCQSFIYCVDGKYAGSNVCPEKMNFVNGRCTYASCPNTGSTSLNSLCQIMPENQYFGSFDDCTEYQICKTGDAQPTVGNCKAPYAFDVKISKCNFATDTKCDGRSGAPSAPPTETCTAGSPPQGDKAVCSVYYTCESEKWVKNTCPIGQYFDLRSSTCKGRQLALPYYSCDRCAGTKATFVNSVDPECNGYLYCVDSIKKSNSTCADDKFFNEDLGACVGTTNLPTYQQTNGACYPDCVCELNADSVCADKYFRPQCCTDAAECDGTTGPVDPNTTVDPNPEPEPETTVDPLAP